MEKTKIMLSNQEKIKILIEQLSPLERRIVPYLNESLEQIMKKTSLDNVSVIRALTFLQQKGIVKIENFSRTIVELGTNGIYYKKNQLPERKLLLFLEDKKNVPIEEARKLSRLSENEFKVSLGVLKDKALISLNNGKIFVQASKEEIMKKFPEEQFIEMLPAEYEKLGPEMLFAFEQLKKRKYIIESNKKPENRFSVTEIGEEIAGKEINIELLEEVTPELIASGAKNKKFRKYDLNTPVPHINGGKRHFARQAVEKMRKIWIEMGFKEMSGPIVETSFWDFDALYTPQDHPAREMQDTFFIKGAKGKLPSKNIVNEIKKAHELGIKGSKGWGYKWLEDEAKKVVLRTHTTSISARTLVGLQEKQLPIKYFAIGKVFRNESVDWSHNFEFYQSEGIVASKEANFRNLLGYLQEFYKKMGFDKIKFVPSFYAYTEPSIEVQVYNSEKKEWFELGGAGIFRPEVIVPLLGKNINVLAWGQGFDRIIMESYKIKDLREMYTNDIKQLREKEANLI